MEYQAGGRAHLPHLHTDCVGGRLDRRGAAEPSGAECGANQKSRQNQPGFSCSVHEVLDGEQDIRVQEWSLPGAGVRLKR